MARTTTAAKRKKPPDDGLARLGAELWELVVAYAKQETLQPVKSLGRYLVFGLAGSLVGAIGVVVLVLAGLRAMQEETGTTFQGAHSWMPYAVCGVGTVAVMAVAGVRILKARMP